MKFILGKKIGMSQIFKENGSVVPATLVEAGPCKVTQIKTLAKDGYQATQIGFMELKKKKGNKQFRYLREFPLTNLKVGEEIKASCFNLGETIRVSGISKAKGFQGGVKRHGFSGFPASHGTKHGLRAPGSIGSAFPERVWKGRKMAGRMGGQRITVKGLEIAQIDEENNLLAIRGAVPGREGTLIEIIATREIEKAETATETETETKEEQKD